MENQGTGIEMLDPDACRRHLGDGGVGCLGFGEEGDAPVLRPVNFSVDGDSLVVRTGEGRILEAARRRERASLLLHGIDKLEHTGWSVIASGVLLEREADARHVVLPLRAWASGAKDHFVALAIQTISGLRIPPGRGNR